MTRARVWLLLLCGSACGLGPSEGAGGGSDNLPISGLGPYGKLEIDLDTPADEPIVLADAAADLLSPSLLERADGGFRIFVERRNADVSEVWLAEVPSLRDLPDVALHRVFAATLPWEGGDLRAPSVAIDGGEVVLAYEAGEPAAIGIARSTDGGQSFVPLALPVIQGARSPSLSFLDGVATVFFERIDRPGIFMASSDDGGIQFEARDEPVLVPSPAPEAFDRRTASAPAGLIRVTPADRSRVDLFYEGRTGIADEIAIGYAGGFDPASLERPFPRDEPILAPGAPSEESPAILLQPTRGIMLFVDRRAPRARIAAAVSP